MIERPTIQWRKVIFKMISGLCIISFIAFILLKGIYAMGAVKQAKSILKIVKYIYGFPIKNMYLEIVFLLIFIKMLIKLKEIMIFVVRIYQRYAPETVRNSCLFTPSCSEYMILSIKKCGCLIGFLRGLNRLRRCQTPNGGIDYP